MLYKIDRNGFVINKVAKSKIQREYKKILNGINELNMEKLGNNLLSIYIEESAF